MHRHRTILPADQLLGTHFTHEELVVRVGPRSGLVCAVAVHSTALGPALGGCRLWSYPDVDAGLRDVLRLSEGMTLKNAAAGLHLGGGKGVILRPPGEAFTPALRSSALADFGDLVESLDGSYLTAEDVGMSPRDMSAIAKRTAHVTGRSRRVGGSGDPSPFTALGVFSAIEAACMQRFGTPELADRSVAVIGLGHVGWALLQLLANAGARLTVTDIDPSRRAEAAELGATWCSPNSALGARVDVVAPCALGGFLDENSVPTVRAAAIVGAANNQLLHPGIAELLAERGVLWVPDFIANAGGVINIAEELGPEGYRAAAARERVLKIGDTVTRLLTAARQAGTTPLAAALALARERIDRAGAPAGSGRQRAKLNG